MHRGHRHLLEATLAAADERGVSSAVLVFDPPPIEVLRPGVTLPRLAPLAMNLELIGAAGIDQAVPIRFDESLRSLRAAEFVAALRPAIDLRALLMTPDSAFGRNRDGTPEAMQALGVERGFDVIRVGPLQADGAPISSTRIRAALRDGDLPAVAMLLGRAPAIRGTVVTGDRRGRDLGFPTANLAFDYRPALPPLGIYVGRVILPERPAGPGHPALVSIGVRPTFHDQGRLLVEVYLLDFDADLYGAVLSVSLEARLRDERRFEDVAGLVAQMHRDEADARRHLGMPR